jgi:hypothetical protein
MLCLNSSAKATIDLRSFSETDFRNDLKNHSCVNYSWRRMKLFLLMFLGNKTAALLPNAALVYNGVRTVYFLLKKKN